MRYGRFGKVARRSVRLGGEYGIAGAPGAGVTGIGKRRLSLNGNLKDAAAGNKMSTYRVLARQALSLDVGSGSVEEFTIQSVACRIVVQASHIDTAKRRQHGGSTLAIEFEADTDLDLFAAGRRGFELLEDFLSAVTVVSGTTFGPSEFRPDLCHRP
jgi:hypothetical protein